MVTAMHGIYLCVYFVTPAPLSLLPRVETVSPLHLWILRLRGTNDVFKSVNIQ